MRTDAPQKRDTSDAEPAANAGEPSPTGVIPFARKWTDEAEKHTHRKWAYVLLLFVLLLGSVWVGRLSWRTDDQLHTNLEVLATTLAFAAGVVALMRYYSRRNNAVLFIGAAFLGTTLLDGYHAIVTSAQYSEAFPSELASLIPWSWTASRLMLSLFLFLSWVFWRRGTRAGGGAFASRNLAYVAVGTASVAAFLIFGFVPLPQAHYPDLWLNRPQELIPAAFFLAALVAYLRKGYWKHSTFEHWLVMSLIVGFMTQAVYMPLSGELFDPYFDVAHLLKIVSYSFVLVGLFVSIFRLFRRSEANVIALAHQAAEVEEARDTALDAVEARSQFLANVSHEIRTPMNAILGMTELALSTELTVEQREYLGTTRTSVEALITIVNDLLDLSKIEAEKLELDSIPFSLRDTVADTVRALSVSADDKGIELLWDMPASIPDSVIGDPGRLRQVLVNLIGNAIKFTPEGRVTVAVVLESLTDDRVELRFDVRDTGIGIPPDKLEHVFEAFTQADASTTRRFGGTGLGLTISSQLVQLMNGTMWAESTPGVGTIIHFTATLVPYNSTHRIISDVRPSDQPPVMMLVGSDDGHHNVVEMLAQGEIRTIIVGSATEAVAALNAHRPGPAPRVLLVDNADGSLAQCEQIMADEALRGLSVLVLVSVGRRGDAAHYRRLGVSGYLTKPVLQTDLIEAVGLFTSGDHIENTFVTVHSLRESRPRLHVLLADDSPTNRQLTVRLLDLRGHTVVTAEDGVQAVEAWRQQPFDIILMDVQMPEMDGIEATATIRETEGEDEHIPIVALTAFATDSDRDRCLVAGMDAYLSKPFRAEQLYAAIEQFGSGSRVVPVAALDDIESSDPIDHEAALEIVGGSAELLAEIAGVFMDEIPGLTEAIAEGLAADDLESVRQASHRLKGSLGMLAARPGQNAAQQLESQATAGEMALARDAAETLRIEMARLEPELSAIASKDYSTAL